MVEIVIQLAIYVCVVCNMENICACSVCRVVKVQAWAEAADASLPQHLGAILGPHLVQNWSKLIAKKKTVITVSCGRCGIIKIVCLG